MGNKNFVQVALSQTELDEMRQAYEQEYVKLKQRMDHLTAILERIGSDAVKLDAPTKKSSFKAVSAPAEMDDGKARRKRRKKRGPKSIWGNFILRRLRQADRPISYAEMIRDAMVLHNLPESKRKNARASILNSSFRLRAIHGKIDTVGEEGKKEKYIVLTKWLDENGALMPPYHDRYTELLKAEGKLSDEVAPDNIADDSKDD